MHRKSQGESFGNVIWLIRLYLYAAVCILPHCGAVSFKIRIIHAAETIQQNRIPCICVLIQFDLRFCLRCYDGIDGSTYRRRTKNVTFDFQMAADRRRRDTPKEDVVSHGLRPDF